MTLKIRNSVKVLLLNDKDEILLLYAIDPLTTSIDGTSNGNFWFLVGGGIEKNETIQETAIREIYEETGLKKEEIILGPLVWVGEVDLILAGIKTRLKEKFIVAHTKNKSVSLNKLTEYEKKVIKKIEWFSLKKIKNSKESIFPVKLIDYLPAIIEKKYPLNPIDINKNQP